MTKLNEIQCDLFSDTGVLNFVQVLLADLHDDLLGKVARFRQLADISSTLGPGGTLIHGGEAAYTAWIEARASFIQGNFIATVLLCQAMAEHLLASYISMGLDPEIIPDRISFKDTLKRCVSKNLFDELFSLELISLMNIRNPLTHYRNIDDPSNLTRRVIDTRIPATEHLRRDASFALTVAVKLLSLPPFWLSGERLE